MEKEKLINILNEMQKLGIDFLNKRTGNIIKPAYAFHICEEKGLNIYDTNVEYKKELKEGKEKNLPNIGAFTPEEGLILKSFFHTQEGETYV